MRRKPRRQILFPTPRILPQIVFPETRFKLGIVQLGFSIRESPTDFFVGGAGEVGPRNWTFALFERFHVGWFPSLTSFSLITAVWATRCILALMLLKTRAAFLGPCEPETSSRGRGVQKRKAGAKACAKAKDWYTQRKPLQFRFFRFRRRWVCRPAGLVLVVRLRVFQNPAGLSRGRSPLRGLR